MTSISKTQEKRLADARTNYEELEKLIAPFIKPRKTLNTTTQGQWQRASSEDVVFTRDIFQDPLRKVTRPVQVQPEKEK